MMTNFSCPHCGNLMADDGSLAGQIVMCPRCGGQLQLASDQSPPPAPPAIPSSYLASASPQSSKQAKRNDNTALMTGAAVGLIAIVGVIAFVVADSMKSHSKPKPVAQGPVLRKQAQPVRRQEETRGDRAAGAAGHNVAEFPTPQASTLEPETPVTSNAKEMAEPADLASATSWQAPSIPGSHPSTVPDRYKADHFSLVTNEFRIRQLPLIHTSFDQRNRTEVNNLDQTGFFYEAARNSLVGPGRYDFDAKEFHLSGVLWYRVDHKRQPSGEERTEHDYCRIDFKLKMEADEAERLRERLDARSAALELWFRAKAVPTADSYVSTRFDVNGVRAYHIVIEAETVEFRLP